MKLLPDVAATDPFMVTSDPVTFLQCPRCGCQSAFRATLASRCFCWDCLHEWDATVIRPTVWAREPLVIRKAREPDIVRAARAARDQPGVRTDA